MISRHKFYIILFLVSAFVYGCGGGGGGGDAGGKDEGYQDVPDAVDAIDVIEAADEGFTEEGDDAQKDIEVEDIPDAFEYEAAECESDEECEGKVPDLKQCWKEACNKSKGLCEAVHGQNDTSCEDGNACTIGDKCQDGACLPGKKVNCAETVCNDGKDNDVDGKTDCQDKDCLLSADCAPACAPFDKIQCGGSKSGSNDMSGSTDLFDKYNCNNYDYPAPEAAYLLEVNSAQNVIVKLTDETDETDVIVVEEANNGCFSMNCVESGLSSVGFLAVAGKKYYLIVDGWNGAIGSYTLSVNCSACEAQCAGKACGPNGCGGLCGNCAAGKTCDLSGASCVDIAANSLCESAKIINHGALPYTDKGSTAAAEDNYFHPEGACVTGSGLPDAGLGARDVAYTITPGKSELFKISMTETDFHPLVYIAEDCNDLFSSCLIAQDMLDSGEMKVALKGGVKYYMIIDGYDGYEAGEFTLSVESLGACVPDCAGKECGGDGCFGTCGGCDVNQECGKDGKCVDKSKNDQCANAKTIDPQNLPFKEKSSTEAASDDYEVPENACPGALQGEFGVQSPDLVYSITPKSDGAYKVYFSDETQFDSALYIVTDCADVAGTCVAGSEVWSDKGGEEISAQLKADTTYYIIVDGYYKNSGVFELVIEKCVPDCQGKECGSDGCGGSCGGCPENEYCSIEYECLASPKNDTCAGAQIISGIPFDTSSTTAVLSDNYSVSADACGGDLTWAAGKGNPDAVFSFTPPETATYHVTVGPAGDWDSAVYILTDCDNPETSCLAGKDEVSQPEHLYAKLTAAKKYYIIVDGYAGGGLFSISVEKCVPQCGGKECGEDGCGGTCGECSGPDEYCFLGECTTKGCGNVTYEGCCESGAVVWCDGGMLNYIYCFYNPEPLGTCGWDAENEIYDCGGSGEDPEKIHPVKCDFTCTPDCDGKECGQDGCGGVCLPGCGGDEFCNSKGLCQEKGMNDTCAGAITVDKMPYQHEGTTSWAIDDYFAPEGACGISWELGYDASDVVYSFKPSASGVYHIYLSPLLLDFDASLYAVTDCGDITSSCQAADDSFMFESLYLNALSTETYYIIVDGAAGGESGSYELNILTCQPDCSGKVCGDDGCGGTCGECAEQGKYCFLGKCVDQGCGDVPYEGCCDGDTLVYCDYFQLVSTDCGKSYNPPMDTCGWNQSAQIYDCGFTGADPSGNFPLQCP